MGQFDLFVFESVINACMTMCSKVAEQLEMQRGSLPTIDRNL